MGRLPHSEESSLQSKATLHHDSQLKKRAKLLVDSGKLPYLADFEKRASDWEQPPWFAVVVEVILSLSQLAPTLLRLQWRNWSFYLNYSGAKLPCSALTEIVHALLVYYGCCSSQRMHGASVHEWSKSRSSQRVWMFRSQGRWKTAQFATDTLNALAFIQSLDVARRTAMETTLNCRVWKSTIIA